MLQGQVNGKQLKKWIQFHVQNDTEHTPAAMKMRRYLNVKDKCRYVVTPAGGEGVCPKIEKVIS